MEQFKIIAYSYSELAQMYFPNISNRSAANQLRRWIKENEKLKEKLFYAGYKPGKKILTPIIVEIIISEFGPPW